MSNLLKIGVSVPNEGLTKAEAYDNHLVWAIHLGRLSERSIQEKWDEQYEFYWFSAGRLLTQYAREQLADRALKFGMDYLLMLDDDMVIYESPDTGFDIFERLMKHKVDIVAPLAFSRNAPHFPVLYHTKEGYDNVTKQEYTITTYIKNYPKNKLIECDAVGFGMVLIDMKVIRGMGKPYFMSTTGTGEDVLFCIKAKKAGFKVFMDTSVKLGHLANPKIITEETFEEMNKMEEYRDIYSTYERNGAYVSEENSPKPFAHE